MRNSEFFLCSIGKTLEQDCFYFVVPEAIDERLVREHRVTLPDPRTGEQNEHKKNRPQITSLWRCRVEKKCF